MNIASIVAESVRVINVYHQTLLRLALRIIKRISL